MRRLFLLLVLSVFLAGCEEDSSQAKVIITVTNVDGVPVQNASIKMYTPVPGSIGWYGQTNEAGQITFASGLEAYQDLKAWKFLYKGCNYVHLKKGEVAEVTVILYPYGEPNGCVE